MTKIGIIGGRPALEAIKSDKKSKSSLALAIVLQSFQKLSRISDHDFSHIHETKVRTRDDKPVEMLVTLTAADQGSIFLSVVYSKERPTIIRVAIGHKINDQVIYTDEVTWRLTKNQTLTSYLTDFYLGELDEIVENAKPVHAQISEVLINTYEFLGKAILSDSVSTPVLNTMVATIKDKYANTTAFKLPYAILIMQSAIAANTVAFTRTEEIEAFQSMVEDAADQPVSAPESDDTTKPDDEPESNDDVQREPGNEPTGDQEEADGGDVSEQPESTEAPEDLFEAPANTSSNGDEDEEVSADAADGIDDDDWLF